MESLRRATLAAMVVGIVLIMYNGTAKADSITTCTNVAGIIYCSTTNY
jgi:hypothetical protein